jgi:hypothetical protein
MLAEIKEELIAKVRVGKYPMDPEDRKARGYREMEEILALVTV